MKTARVETDKFYHAIVHDLENKVLLDDGTNQNLKDCITEMNAIITDFKNKLAQEYAHKNKDKEPPKDKIIEVEKIDENKYKITNK